MKRIVLLFLLTFSLSAKNITVNDVYAKVMLISDEVHFLLKYKGIEYNHNEIIQRTHISTKLKPRNTWQMTYEIMVKINMLRDKYNLPIIEPVNMAPVLNLNPDLVYEQTLRILTELKIFKIREGIKSPVFKEQKYTDKTPIDVYNSLTHISKIIDKLNDGGVTTSYVFGEQMRLYDDLTLILQHFHIKDKTIPKKKNLMATSEDVFNLCMNILDKIRELQIGVGIDFVDFSEFKKGKKTSVEVYTITQMIIAEIQTIKAYIGIDLITPVAVKYNKKTSIEVEQLVSWNLRKLNLIHSLNKR